MERLYVIVAIEIISMILLGLLICYVIKIQFSLKCENRLAGYAIKPKEKYSLPFFDKIIDLIFRLIKSISKVLSKSEFLKKYSKRYNKYIEYNEKEKRKAIDYVSLKLVVGVLIFFLYIITGLTQTSIDLMLGLLIFIISFFIPDLFLMVNQKQKMKHLEEDLLEAVIIMNNAFKSGKNILEAIEIVKLEIEGPLKDEFRKIYLDLTHGLDIDVVFNRFYERIKIEDIKYMTSSLTLLNKTGGNIVKVFSSIENNFYDKKVLNQELESLTSSSKFMYKMLLFMPFILISIIMVLNPSYFTPLFTTKPGIMILLLAVLLYLTYAFIIKRVTRVKL